MRADLFRFEHISYVQTVTGTRFRRSAGAYTKTKETKEEDKARLCWSCYVPRAIHIVWEIVRVKGTREYACGVVSNHGPGTNYKIKETVRALIDYDLVCMNKMLF